MFSAIRNTTGRAWGRAWFLAAALVGGGLLGAGYTPEAAAQGVYSKQGVAKDGAKGCPGRWHEGSNFSKHNDKSSHCYPMYGNSPKIYRSFDGKCNSGYGLDRREWCVEGFVEDPELNRAGVFTKQNMTDRCPAGFHTYKDKCTSDYAKQAKARPKGNGQCKAGEIEEWGIWCVSDYQHLTKHNLTSAALRDWNNIYTFSGGKSPKQGPKSSDKYSEVYIALYGQPEPEPVNVPTMNGIPVTGDPTVAPAAGGEVPAASAECAAKSAIGGALGGLLGSGGAAAAAVAQKAMGC